MTNAFFSKIEEPRIIEAIRGAELRCRGEIRVHITEDTVGDAIKEAGAAFERLGMTATAERNGVLIFVAPRSQKFAVLGDSGITSVAGPGVFDEIASAVSTAFRDARYTDGLVQAVERAGELLAVHFPRIVRAVDRDELSNSISRD